MYLKITQTPHPIRTPLLRTVSNPAVSGKSIHAGWSRTVSNLRKVGVALTPNLPTKPLSNHKRKTIVGCLRTRFLQDHTKALTVAKSTTPARPSGARSKLDLFCQSVGPPSDGRRGPRAYSEFAKLALISNTQHRSALRHIRCGLVGHTAPARARARPPAVPMQITTCSCDPTGSTIKDPTHLVLECPHNEVSRQRVRTALRVALPLAHPRLQFVTSTLSNEKLILASLGAPMHQLPPHHPLYEAFIQAAAAAWFSETIPLGVCLRVSS